MRKNKTRADSFIATEHHQEGIAAHISHIENSFINEILKYKEINEIKAIY